MSHIHGESIEEIEIQAEEKMAKTIDDLRREMASIRTGRASVHILDSVKADYYGTPTPISQMATISTPEPSLITGALLLLPPLIVTAMLPMFRIVHPSILFDLPSLILIAVSWLLCCFPGF